MTKAIYFDMDGTLANLYCVENWLPKLMAEDPSPYIEAKPLVNMAELATVLYQLRNAGYILGVITWLSKDASASYKKAVRQAKNDWLKKNLPFIFDEVHMVRYGAPKHLSAKIKNSIIVDDDDRVLSSWEENGGLIIDARYDIIESLRGVMA